MTSTKKKPARRTLPVEAVTENPDLVDEKQKKSMQIKDDFKSKRAVGQFLAKKAQNSLRQSKAVQTQNKLEKLRNKKKARMEKDKRVKLQTKREKHKKGPTKAPKVNKFSRHKRNTKKGHKK